eukprot:6449341-Prymnesium_polylepis.1
MDDDLSAYEIERRDNIARNHSRLRELGLEAREERPTARGPASTASRKRPRPPPSAPPDTAGLRRSGRDRTPVSRFGDVLPSDEMSLERARRAAPAAG